MPGKPAAGGEMTSIAGRELARIRHSAAADRPASTVPGPPASTAAIHQPSSRRARCPTAYVRPDPPLARHAAIVATRASRIATQSHQISAASVPQLRAPPRDVLPELLVHARVHRGLLVLLDRLAPDLARALGRVAPAVALPAVEVLRRA